MQAVSSSSKKKKKKAESVLKSLIREVLSWIRARLCLYFLHLDVTNFHRLTIFYIPTDATLIIQKHQEDQIVI